MQINYLETPFIRDVLDLLVFLSYWDSFTLSQISFLKMFTLQTTIAYSFCDHCYSRWLCSLCEDLISSNIILTVVWQNYFLASMSVYIPPLISECGYTLEINTFILVNLTSHKRSANFAFSLKCRSYMKNIRQRHFWSSKLRSLSSKIVL